MKQRELMRLSAIDGDKGTGAFGIAAASMVILNPLAASIYISLSSSTPTLQTFDIVVPGEALMTYPVRGFTRATAVVDYPGGVPAADAGLHAVLSVTEAELGATIGPLAG